MVGGGGLVAGGGSVGGDWGVLALVINFREVMLTSPLELAHCAPLSLIHIGRPPPLIHFGKINNIHIKEFLDAQASQDEMIVTH